jgi:hypothetical protein
VLKQRNEKMEFITLTFLASIFLGMISLILEGRKKEKKSLK